jgi:hypothetical protein
LDHLTRADCVDGVDRADADFSVAVLARFCAGSNGADGRVELCFFDDDSPKRFVLENRVVLKHMEGCLGEKV